MILVHRLNGEALFLNADLIETVEAGADTVLTLVDGRCVLVREPAVDIVERIAGFRAAVIFAADELRAGARPALRLLPDADA